LELEVLATPGHTDGNIFKYCRKWWIKRYFKDV
jgi:hypothetical protein